MASSRCRFCGHDNPGGAKFCNDCGSPLHLKPCPQCEAINNQVADHCYQCGFSLAGVATDTASVESASAVLDSPSSPRPPTAGPGDIPEEFLADPFDVVMERMDRARRDAESGNVGVQGGEMAGTDANAKAKADAEYRNTPDPIPVLSADRRDFVTRSSASMGSVLAVALLAIAIGGGYYAYRHEVAAGWLRAGPAVGLEQGEARSPPAGSNAPAIRDGGAATPSDPERNAAIAPIVETAPPSAAETFESASAPTASKRTSKTRSTHAGAGQSSDRPDRSAIETQRIISREIGGPAATPGSTTRTPADKSAIETQRIISREMGNFTAPPKAD
jgi:hypothetical protein